MNAVSITKLHHKLAAVTAERDALAAELQKWRESVSELLTHIEDVVGDELWQKICAAKWNNVSALLQSAEGYSSQAQNGGAK